MRPPVPSRSSKAHPALWCIRHAWAVILAAFFLLVPARVAPAQSPPPAQGTPGAAPAATQAETVPPVPTHWFSDHARLTGPLFAVEMDRRLERFERDTTNRLLVVILPRLPPGAAMDDYCLRTFNTWHVGQKGINNGVVLFVFAEDRKLRIEVGRGLEGVLTNAACQDIVRTITASFRTADYEGGLTAGVDAIIKTLCVQPPLSSPTP